MINRFRGPSATASSKATSQTLCQKCLKRDKFSVNVLCPIPDTSVRHYSYECKAPAQERPYTSRPSRTQQLANPKLVPTLTSNVPNDLLRKKGIADEELAKKEAERSRKRKIDGDDHMNAPRKRSRSLSSTSVSTISTNLSRSPSPKHVSHGHTGQSQLLADLNVDRKRRRSLSTSMSYTSESSHDKAQRDRSRIRENKSRRWRSSVSPDVHRRERDHRRGSRDRATGQEHRRRAYSRSRSISSASDSSFEDYRRRSTHRENRSKRRRHSSRSPDDRGRDRDVEGNRGSRRTKSPYESRDRSQVIKNRKSMTPGIPSRRAEETRGRNHRPSIDRGDKYAKDNDRYGGSARDQGGNVRPAQPPPSAPPPRKDRSLSPFSKRLLLTQAMNMGR